VVTAPTLAPVAAPAAAGCPPYCGLLPAKVTGVCLGKVAAHADDNMKPAAVRFVERLTHTKGKWAGQPFHPRAWQADILTRLFGALQGGRRQYRTCYVEIPRKNGKTEIAAGIALYMLLADGEAGAEVYGAAGDLEQAALCYNVAAQMVRNDPTLSKACEIIDSKKRIVFAAQTVKPPPPPSYADQSAQGDQRQ
jgi:phage terminase large subunit-like protein